MGHVLYATAVRFAAYACQGMHARSAFDLRAARVSRTARPRVTPLYQLCIVPAALPK